MNTTIRHINTYDTLEDTSQTVSRGHYTLCPMCHNVKYKKQWYAPGSKVAIRAQGKKAHTEVRRCPACEMKIEGLYNAIVVIHDVPNKLRDRVVSVIEHEATSAMHHNPQNRVLEIIATIDGYRVHTTTAKVARAISQKLQTIFKASEVVSYLEKSPFRHHKSELILRIATYL